MKIFTLVKHSLILDACFGNFGHSERVILRNNFFIDVIGVFYVFLRDGRNEASMVRRV